ncbi:N-acetyltransferase [Spiroplasma sp. NBRC 100390]|uniref:GNAT family N-acetyltransferase n=1 Tax=unclassified Spiroplasma TaxID=2637901 RepID=UPI0008927FFE|nr:MULTISPECIES: N-acetyltransferase [unclassified Spiroplasma]AOX43844.1 N-acetyltransferase [Spiroplasma sp. TU-14]APE13314.1 N-acetyltransferase [Spiroplasma sp. NBRC 100390]
MEIRTIKEEEKAETRKIIFKAFNTNDKKDVIEHILVDNLRLLPEYDPTFDVVAIINNQIVGHAFLSTVTINDNHKLLALAPIAVQKEYQGQKIGTKLIKFLEDKATTKGYQAIFILGDPNYYSKFNYVPAINYAIKAPFEIEDKYFMVKELYLNSLSNTTGTLKYSPPFRI